MAPNDFTGSPGYFTHDSVVYQLMDENWNARSEIVTAEQRTNLQGKIGEREEFVRSVISGQPIAFKTGLNAAFGKLVPYHQGNRGQRIRGTTDKPLVIQTTDGRSITFTSAVLTQQATLQLAPNRPLFGPVEFTCLRKATGASTASDAHVAEASSTYTEPALDPDDILSTTYTYAFGASSPLNAIEPDEDGVTIEFSAQLNELRTATNGLLNFQIGDCDAQIRFKPMNLTAANFYDSLVVLDGTGAGRGKWLGGRGLAFTVTGATAGDPLISIPLATSTNGQVQFGAAPRVGEVVLKAQRKYASGALQAMWTLGVVP